MQRRRRAQSAQSRTVALEAAARCLIWRETLGPWNGFGGSALGSQRRFCDPRGRMTANAANTLGRYASGPPVPLQFIVLLLRLLRGSVQEAWVPPCLRRCGCGGRRCRRSGLPAPGDPRRGRRRTRRRQPVAGVGRWNQQTGPRHCADAGRGRVGAVGSRGARGPMRQSSYSPTAGAAATRSGCPSPAGSGRRVSAWCSTTSEDTGRAQGGRRHLRLRRWRTIWRPSSTRPTCATLCSRATPWAA